jgi:hypothetical protein
MASMSKPDRDRFISALAKFLTEDAARLSIKLQMGRTEAKRWAALRETTPLFGWPSEEEAEKTLQEWFASWQ